MTASLTLSLPESINYLPWFEIYDLNFEIRIHIKNSCSVLFPLRDVFFNRALNVVLLSSHVST